MTENYKFISDEVMQSKFHLISNTSENLLSKGDGGRICVVGGSANYTGAPYFASISAFLSGADIVYNICTKDASVALKSYDPNLIVMPYLDMNCDDFQTKFSEMVLRIDGVVFGPGLGRDPELFENSATIIRMCSMLKTPLVIDADGIFFLSNNANLFAQYPGRLVITPNCNEINRLIENIEDLDSFLTRLCGFEICVLLKGVIDRIFIKTQQSNLSIEVSNVGSVRRCGGQGDMLAGILGAFICHREVPIDVVCYSAAFITRMADKYAFDEKNRCMLTTDMIEILPNVLQEFIFRNKPDLDTE